ncbi:MAG TPA: formylglycine-generating enzyme family protein, partial [Chloroflexota bacterium]|nr:formylglycine-generating enzyme family protein [Chloroflexota bacterium]
MKPLRRAFLSVVLPSIALVLAAASLAGSAPGRVFQDCPDCPEMVAIPAGHFVMGSPVHEKGRFDSEGPQHPVSVHGFALGKYDVTVGQFLAFLKETGYQPAPCDPILDMTWRSPGEGIAYAPSDTDALDEPAICVNWYDAQAYIAWLNARVHGRVSGPEAGPYRLPSEAEWEYAARAGTGTARWWGEAIGVATPTATAAAADGTAFSSRHRAASGPIPSGSTTCWAMPGNGRR